jgi:hypothetical protein
VNLGTPSVFGVRPDRVGHEATFLGTIDLAGSKKGHIGPGARGCFRRGEASCLQCTGQSILMPDNMANVRRYAQKNRGLALANLVPTVLEAGYDLRRVDEVPEIAAAAAPPRVALRGRNQEYVRGVAPSW